MKNFCKFLFIFILALFGLFRTTRANEVCEQKSACKCLMPSGEGIDLAQVLGTTQFLQTRPDQNLTYFWRPCNNTLQLPDLPSKSSTCNGDNKGYSLCVYDSDKQTFSLLGRSDEVSFHPSADNNQYLIYTLPNSQKTYISLICVSNFDKSNIFVNPSAEANQTNLILYSPYACLQQIGESEYLSTGAVLLILFFTAATIYLFGGMAVRYFFLGARGTEMVPNLDFWRDLPTLVRDGVRFIQNGCRVVPAPDDTYDAI